MEDDTFNGMFIPKGTMVFANAWYVVADVSVLLRDPDHYYLRFGYLYHTVAGPWLWTHASTTTLSYSSPNVSCLGHMAPLSSSRTLPSDLVAGTFHVHIDARIAVD